MMELNPLKRSLGEDEEAKTHPLNLTGSQFLPTPTPTVDSNTSDATASNRLSPAPSESELSSIQDVSSIGGQDTTATIAGTTGNPAKRRKLSPEEKAQRELEKRAKERERELKKQEQAAKKVEQAELKAKRDEEKHIRDLEKQKKAEDREARKREKDLEEERKAQEKLSKERSQMRLGAFFKPPANAETPSDSVMTRRRSLSLETFDAIQNRTALQEQAKSHQKPVAEQTPKKSDYQTYFLPFEVRPHTRLYRTVTLEADEIASAQTAFDVESLRAPSAEELDLGLPTASPDLSANFSRSARRACRLSSTRQIYHAAHQSGASEAETSAKLATVPIRYIHFHNDVRPPYVGTYSTVSEQETARSARINPFIHVRQDTKYEEDSEAEWEEPEEGEDICIDDEEDKKSEADDSEMGEFLDDEDDEAAARRRAPLVELPPNLTGICWQNQNGGQCNTAMSTQDRDLLSSLRLQVLLTDLEKTGIDPFSTSYWHVSKPCEKQDDRRPLAERSSNTPSKKARSEWPITATEQKRGLKAGAQKTMSSAEFEEFKQSVVGSSLSKSDMVNHLKKSFPSLMISLIKDSLSERFAQVGKSKADKKWAFVA